MCVCTYMERDTYCVYVCIYLYVYLPRYVYTYIANTRHIHEAAKRTHEVYRMMQTTSLLFRSLHGHLVQIQQEGCPHSICDFSSTLWKEWFSIS